VLVVDDDPGLQDLFRTFLKKIGFSRVVVRVFTTLFLAQKQTK